MAQEMCSVHPDKEVVDVCVHCGRRVCVACAATLASKTYCLECIKLVDATPAGQLRQTTAWENRGEIGFFKALSNTWLDIVLHPKRFFSDMPTKAGIGSPLLFGLICGSSAVIISALINMAVVLSGGTVGNFPPGAPAPPKPALIGSYVVLMVVAPVLVAGGIFALSLLYHLVVLIFGGREGFRATFRVLSYTNGLAVINIIPVLGPVFVTVYSIILFAIGFKYAHKMNTAKAVISAVLPMLVLFVIGFAAAFYLASKGALPSFGHAVTPPAGLSPGPAQ